MSDATTLHWTHLYDEVVRTGLCTGCAGCVVACPHDVLGYDDGGGVFRPFHLEDETGPGGCSHGERGCTLCTRACPRFGDWEPELDRALFGRTRRAREVAGVAKDVVLARATDDGIHGGGQDGGVVSAILVYALEHDLVDAALVSYLEGDGSAWRAVPGVATTRDDVLRSSGSRYTYSANTLAYEEAVKNGAERLALVGMSCQSSVPPALHARRAGKVGRHFALNIGLLCSKTFDDRIFDELLEPEYGLPRYAIKKMNIKGVLQIWTYAGRYVEVPLKEAHAFTREGCTTCPDFAAEHADIATGGIGAFDDWTLTIVRTDAGRQVVDAMVAGGWLETRPADHDPGAVQLLHRLAARQRKRWPESAVSVAPRAVDDRAPSIAAPAVAIDQSLCTGCSLCEKIAPEVFVGLPDRLYYVRDEDGLYAGAQSPEQLPAGREGKAVVPRRLQAAVREAAQWCPESCIHVED